jgi:hypothetical protein
MLQATDVDSDGDGLSDWEEATIGFNPQLDHSDRDDTEDLTRVQSTLNATSAITVGLIDGDMREDWPDKGMIAIRRSGGLKPLTINVTFSGSADAQWRLHSQHCWHAGDTALWCA